jgi:uncharacterized Tic20 family protein
VSDGLPPPGWYFDGQVLRWWSGTEWGPAAPHPLAIDPSSPEAGKTWAIVSHLGVFIGGFILPLVAYVTQKDKNAFARHHAAESLNFQLTLLLVQLAMVPVFIATVVASIPEQAGTTSEVPWGILVIFPLFFIVWIGAVVLSILGAIRANELVWWTYPIRIPFVRSSP